MTIPPHESWGFAWRLNRMELIRLLVVIKSKFVIILINTLLWSLYKSLLEDFLVLLDEVQWISCSNESNLSTENMTHLGFHPPLPPEICVIEHKASMNSVFISNLFLLKFLGEFGDGRGQKLTHSKALRNCIFTRLNVIVFLATIFCNTQNTHGQSR